MNTENWFDKFSVLEAKDNRKNLVDPIINNIYDKSVKKAYMEGSEYNKSLPNIRGEKSTYHHRDSL